MAMIGQRAGFRPIEPQNDEMMGIRNLQATSGGAIYAPDQYYATQVGISGLGDAYSDRAASFARNVAADAHSGMGATDEQSNARYQELVQHESELKKQIQELEANIAYQEKLRAIEMKNDPMWDIAKQEYIMKGDSTRLEGIMSRIEAEKNRDANAAVAKEAKQQEMKQKKEADIRAATSARYMLNEALKDYEAVQADPNKRMEVGRELMKQYANYKEKAEAAGLDEKDLYKEMPTELERVKMAISEARETQTQQIAKAQANAKAAKAKKNEDNTVSDEIDSFNAYSHGSKALKAKKDELIKKYPNYTFTIAKGGKITWQRKESKK